MSGNQTNGYDFVIELSESFYNDLFAAILDSDGFLCNRILEPIGAGSLCDIFTVSVSMDRPTDVSIPPTAQDLVDLRVDLGEDGSNGNLRIVAGIDVDRSGDDFDHVRLNFEDLLFFAEASLVGIPIPSALLSGVLRDQVHFLYLPPPIPVERASTEPTDIRRLDARIIDHTASPDLDASAFLLTFGGGAPGDATAFTESFIPAGDRGGMALFFDWLCRILSPAVEQALDLTPGAFEDCRLRETVEIDEDEEVDLTRLELVLVDDFLQLTAAVRKSGFCYEATGTITARLRIAIEGGQFIVESEVDDPDIDIDIPWECWLVAIAVSAILALLGGVLFGVIGAIVGAVIVPLIMWITTEVVEGVIEKVASRVAGAINDISPEIDVPAVGINLVFQEVFIDDILVSLDPQVFDNVPVRAEGVVRLRSGDYFDLDRGKVGEESLPGADLSWVGSQFFGLLRTVCNSALARTGSRAFDAMSRSRLYTYSYESPAIVPLPELAQIDPFGVLTGDTFDETRYVFGVRTSEDRFAAIRVIEVDLNSIRLQYKTFEKNLPTVEIAGDFECERAFLTPEIADVVFTPVSTPQPEEPSSPQPPCGIDHAVARTVQASVPRQLAEEAYLDQIPRADRRIGRWTASFPFPRRDVGRFDALTNGLKHPLSYQWEIEGQILEDDQGRVRVKGVNMNYSIQGRRLTLSVSRGREIEFELRVTVQDAQEMELTTSRCIRYTPECAQTIRHIPDWDIYQATHLKVFGVVEVPPRLPQVD